MSDHYHIEKEEPKAEIKVAAERLTRISELLASSKKQPDKNPGRNILTRAIDSTFALVRKYLPPLHWLVVALAATVMFLYAQVVAFTARLVSTGSSQWPNIPAPCVLALWHRDAPSLLVIFAKRRPPCRTAIMVSHDPRGDSLALLCRMIGFHVVRGDAHPALPCRSRGESFSISARKLAANDSRPTPDNNFRAKYSSVLVGTGLALA